MVKAAENSLVWNKQTLADYLHNPAGALVRGTRMLPVRITSEQDIDDLIAYLAGGITEIKTIFLPGFRGIPCLIKKLG